MPLMTRKRQLAAKVETTYGQAIALAAADAVDRVTDPALAIVRAGILIDNQGGLGVQDAVPGDASTTLGFRLWCNGPGSVAAPGWFKYLEASGMSLETATLSTTDDTTAWKGLTAGLYRDGRLFSGRGIMGNARFAFVAGKPVEMTFDGKGGFVSNPTDTPMLTSITYNITQPPVWAGAGSLTFDGSAAIKIAKLDLDLGNEVALREDPNSAGGYVGGWIGNRVPKVTMDPEAAAIATRSFWDAQSDGTAFDLVLVAGATTGNILTWTLSDLKVQDAPPEGDRDGKVVDNPTFVVTGGITLAVS